MGVLFGCVLRSDEGPALTGEALSRASFVGHDSSGIAFVGAEHVEVLKDAKPVGELLKDLDLGDLRARACIGHTLSLIHI